uniref:Uncharacterized protein n=1 Tax=Suricata suricatta TaxID=37032 RepID=A0A673VAI2_SURSU
PAPPRTWGPRRPPGEGARARSGANGALPWCQLQEPSLYTIKAVFILDNDGHRLLAKILCLPLSHPPLLTLSLSLSLSQK